ncbi:hypothetical protein F5Y11DRAFT_190348 [Daldinia sp. FL1419]|nr:hypothetical protein F5Y11DRAFT_190348 [Daldinia sp. FL1419]
MADMPYRRSGRGGAGNFYSQKDIEEVVAKRKSEDPEAQKSQPLADDEPLTDPADGPAPLVPTTTTGSTASGVKTYARSGRGGAGNFVDPSVATTISTAQAAKPQNQSHLRSPPASPRRGGASSGRGGAGNWTSEHGDEPYDREQERKRREALDAHILQDIRNSLPQPPKIHYMHGPGRGRKPDLPV